MEGEKEKRIEEICIRILASSRNELYLHMRFFDVALSSFLYEMDTSAQSLGTDGVGLYYEPGWLGGLYRKGRREVNRAYLHIMLHCIFGHLWKEERIRKKRACARLGIAFGEEDELVDILWDTACDIAVESIIDGSALHCVKRPMSRDRRLLYERLRKQRRILNAESVFEELVNLRPDKEQALLWYQEFWVDDHRIWNRKGKRPSKEEPKEDWEDIRDKIETELQTFGRDMAEDSPELLEQIKAESREGCDYRDFLRKFAVLREEQQLDVDAFDPVFYSYGLSLYGNMPLIEPQETREVKKIEDFVIAIDTSMSCSGELVRGFLRETYSILKEQESFFRKMNIHILQCDEKVQRDKKITSQEELKEYMENLELSGQGGTDFRPVFAHVEELQRNREFSRLRGLLYFTDGKGIFPKTMPPYDTAFLLYQKDWQEVDVPAWAMKVYLREEDLETEEQTSPYV